MPEIHNPLEGDRPELTINLHDGSDEQISIIIVHKDRPEYLNMALQSTTIASFNNNYEIIVVDNGSTTKDSLDFLDDLQLQKDIKVIRNEKNLFWSAACNRGVAAADKNSKYFVFLHCDVVILNPAWLDLMINVSESQQSGLVGCEFGSYQLQNQKVDFIQEWIMFMTRECYKTIGGWPERLPQIGHSFIVTLRAQQTGFKPQVMKNQIAHHYKIFSLDISDYERMTERALNELPGMLRDAQSISVNPIG
jgi:GT2 family glycosyltransferase